MEKLAILWDVVKIFLIPLCIWYFERQVQARDEKREKEFADRKRELDAAHQQSIDMQFLMMERIDNLSDTTHLMAKKLHDAGIINGDLAELDDKYKGLDAKYHDNLRRMALDVLNSN